MTTLCLCDWVESREDRERRTATVAPSAIVADGRIPTPANDIATPRFRDRSPNTTPSPLLEMHT